ncbi:glycosyl transferase, group 2 family protein [Acidithiobacillus ferrooxidans ATCC 23270]|uniref:Glycosyl transferase, group 2 family protein n=1 Tax=Acidithiobacillus ferrooxidans (strain ATCC 23270 / DSM 14882 / CIP 104768 / NCIMB 8455) TaxID=243159 RepID=B7J9F1_ACIF2|nr:glycosyltransferase [Acidithiobacillus ferrooxidans]ACK78867.1 glycosyl transferase, group 2 family protein [Acidithiobacillus ferrooxidans ATCC 23270]
MNTIFEQHQKAHGQSLRVNNATPQYTLPVLVTVIVTVYKRTKFLKEAIGSVLNQKFHSFEIIVTDDSNSDAVMAICDLFNNSQIRYRANSVALGVALNLRVAISEARGEYIAILNDDDVWEPDFLESLVFPLQVDSEISLAFCDHWITSEDGSLDLLRTNANSLHYGRDILPEGYIYNLEELVLEKNSIPMAMAAIFRKNAIDFGLLVSDVVGAYDFWLACLLAAYGRPAYYVSRRLTRYRVHGQMETVRKAPDKNKNMIYIYEKLIELNLFPKKIDFLHRKCSKSYFQVGKDYLWFNKSILARNYFFGAFGSDLNCKALLYIALSYLPRNFRNVLKITAYGL